MLLAVVLPPVLIVDGLLHVLFLLDLSPVFDHACLHLPAGIACYQVLPLYLSPHGGLLYVSHEEVPPPEHLFLLLHFQFLHLLDHSLPLYFV